MSILFNEVKVFISNFLLSQENSKELISAWEDSNVEFTKICNDSILNVIKTYVEDGFSNVLNNNGGNSFTTPKTKKSRKKDTNAPKKPLNGYFLYCNDNRSIFKSKNPGIRSNELVLVLADAWKEHKKSNSEIFQKYSELSEKDKERYIKETEEYNNASLERKEVVSDNEVVNIKIVEEKKQKPSKKAKKNDIVSDTEIIEEKKKKKKKSSKKEESELVDE